ncbi:caspase family protein [Streptomyces sp. NPDC048737]|uniref:caspase family protein n=1 Tax=unclassified Streptomyces TaxID=2593676 RepID=UPI003446EF3A
MTSTKHALIIANDRYEDRGLKQLRAPAQDAAALAEVLHDPEIGDFEVEVVRNEPAHLANRRIQQFFNDRRRDDTLLVHFSCHGLKSESGELYFAASDTDPRLLDATAVPAHFVRRCMSRTRAGSTVLFLDCCYGGAFSRGSGAVRATGEVNVLESFRDEKPPGGRGRAVITASNSMEYAFEGPDLAEDSGPRPSVFTHAVVQGLESGDADRNGDGVVTLDELYDYVYDRVREANPHQTPSKDVEMEGELKLANNRRGRLRITKVPSPPYLLAAIDSDNPLTRQGAVHELRARMHDDSLPVAEGARQDLEAIARDDIRQIADQADQALREIRLAPSPDRLDFGRVPPGSPAPRRTVALAGPPLARHCVAQSTRPWLRVEPTRTGGLDVSVEPSAEGPLAGEIVLKGVTGDAVIHVTATVGAEAETEIRPTGPTGPGAGQPTADLGPLLGDPPAEPPGPVVVHPEPPSRPPRVPAAPRDRRAPARDRRRAPALAGAALTLAVTAVITVVVTLQKVATAVDRRLHPEPGDNATLEEHFRELGVLTPLTVSLTTAALALLLSAFARHDLGARRDLYSPRAAGGTGTLTAIARGLALPALVLAVLTALAYLIGAPLW